MWTYGRPTRELPLPSFLRDTPPPESRFVRAVKSGDLSRLQQLLRDGYSWDIDRPGPDGMCALHWAAKLGQVDMLILLLPLMNPDTADENHRTALFYATENDTKAPEIIELLLQHGAKATWADLEGKTALRLAAEKGKVGAMRKLVGWDNISLLEAVKDCEKHHDADSVPVKEVETLLGSAADINARTEDGSNTVLHIAAKNGCVAVASLLLKCSLKLIKTRNSERHTPLHVAAQSGCENVARVLLEQDEATIEARTDRNLTALHLAALQGHKEVVSLLIEKGANFMAETSPRYTPVYLACSSGYDEVATMFLDQMTKEQALSATNENSEPLLWVALRYNCFEVAKRLVQYAKEDGMGGKLLSDEYHGWTPVILALEVNNQDAAKLLVENGASAEGTDIDGNTALHWTSAHGMAELLSSLLDGYAEEAERRLTLTNHQGMTPLDRAAAGQHAHVVRLLLQRNDPERLSGATTDSWTALHWAAWYERLDLIRLLIAHHADLSAVDHENRTPFDISRQRGTNSIEILEWLALAGLCNSHKEDSLLERPVLKSGADNVRKNDYVHLMGVYPRAEVEKSRFTVLNVIYQYGPSPLMAMVANSWGIQEDLRFRWVHLPVNNKTWIKDILQSIYFDRKEQAVKKINETASISDVKRESQHSEHISSGLESSTSKLSDRDVGESDSSVSSAISESGETTTGDEEVTWYHTVRELLDNCLARDAGGQRFRFLESQSTVVKYKDSPSGAKFGVALSVPYFSFQKIHHVDNSRPFQQGLFQESEHLTKGKGGQESQSRRCINGPVKDSENFGDGSVHFSLTLDEYYYSSISSTDKRNRDQVLFRHQQRMARPPDEQNCLICMVDQLWIFLADDETIVTSCSEQRDGESTTIQDTIRNHYINDKDTRPGIKSAISMVPLIMSLCSRQAVDLWLETDTGRKNILQVFGSEIARMADLEVELFDRFKTGLDKTDRMPSENQISGNGGISKEIELLKEVKDILDELNIINTVLIRQKNTIKTAVSGLGSCDVRGTLLDHYYIFSKIEHTTEEVERLIYDAKEIQKNINHLLDLRQKDANLSEAIWARNSAENTARQGRTILVFTVVTIIFLPVTFLTSLFALNITSFPHDTEGMLSYSPEWAFSRLFGITIAVSAPLIIVAFFMGQISEFGIAFLNTRAGKKGNHKAQEVPDGGAGNTTKEAVGGAGRDEDARKTWRERILRRRWRKHPVRENISGV